VHRCGRTGRAGRYGVSHTFVVKGLDEKFMPKLVLILRKANQLVVDDLRIMASIQGIKTTTTENSSSGREY